MKRRIKEIMSKISDPVSLASLHPAQVVAYQIEAGLMQVEVLLMQVEMMAQYLGLDGEQEMDKPEEDEDEDFDMDQPKQEKVH